MKKFLILFLTLFVFVFSACAANNFCAISFELELDGEAYNQKAILVKKGTVLDMNQEIDFGNYTVEEWFLDEAKTLELPEGYIIKENIVLYATLQEVCKITYVNYDGSSEYDWVKKGECAKEKVLSDPDMEFLGWFDRTLTKKFDFESIINENTVLFAKWDAEEFTVTYNLGFEYYETKDLLYKAFFTDFYDFLITKTDIDMEILEIASCEEFLEVCADWNAYGKDSFYGVGDMFSKYYVSVEIGGKLENQPTDTFIGHCYQQGRYVEFIKHLMVFFEYWRTDEGYTGGADDPNNLGNDFFAEPWASLVDTCKFFKFTSENLNDTYSWFRSERVKDALDNIPSVINVTLDTKGTKIDPVYLPHLNVRDGYTFVGWVDENNKEVESIYEEAVVSAVWKKN